MRVELDEKAIDAIFARLDQGHGPGAAVGIAIGGRPVYRKGFGLASMELPVLLSPTMRMRIYSTTKHFACLAYLLLCEEGKAAIDDPLGKYLPELHRVTHRVTMRQLMGNTGGLRDVHDINWQFSGTGHAVSSADLLSLYRDIDDVSFAPGTSWCYSNGGFLLLSFVIERITGQSLEEVLRERIFVPVGMTDTLLRRYDTDFVPNSATMHTTDAAGAYEKSYLGTASAGEGGMVSTVDDMLRWLAHMDAPWVGRDSTWSLMRTPQVLANGTSTGYGLGLIESRYRDVDTLYHGGGGLGANSQMLKVPGAGLDVVVMLNCNDPVAASLTDQILDACLPGLEPPQSRADYPLTTGTFHSPKTDRVIQLLVREGRQVMSIDGADYIVEPDDDGVLWPSGARAYLKQGVTRIGDTERPASIRLSDFGSIDDLVAVKCPAKLDVRSIVGRYCSESTGTEATVVAVGEGVKLRTVGRFAAVEFNLECLADEVWRARSTGAMAWGGILVFDRDAGAFRFWTCCTRGLPFSRGR